MLQHKNNTDNYDKKHQIPSLLKHLKPNKLKWTLTETVGSSKACMNLSVWFVGERMNSVLPPRNILWEAMSQAGQTSLCTLGAKIKFKKTLKTQNCWFKSWVTITNQYPAFKTNHKEDGKKWSKYRIFFQSSKTSTAVTGDYMIMLFLCHLLKVILGNIIMWNTDYGRHNSWNTLNSKTLCMKYITLLTSQAVKSDIGDFYIWRLHSDMTQYLQERNNAIFCSWYTSKSRESGELKMFSILSVCITDGL